MRMAIYSFDFPPVRRNRGDEAKHWHNDVGRHGMERDYGRQAETQFIRIADTHLIYDQHRSFMH
jgi:hypothetical protein